MILPPRWRKALRDLWTQKSRTVLVASSIAIGVFSVGMISITSVLLSRTISESWHAVRPASATLFTEPFDEELLWTIRRMPEVEDADARNSFSVRFTTEQSVQTTGYDDSFSDEDIEWRNLSINTFVDMDDIRIQQLEYDEGVWPPQDRDIFIERSSLEWIGVEVGETIRVESRDGHIRELRVAGIVHDLMQISAGWVGYGVGYVNRQTVEWLGYDYDFDELNFIVAENQDDKDHIQEIADVVSNKIEKGGRTVYSSWVPDPGRHFTQDVMDAILLILGILGALTLILSSFMVVNTMQAILSQQTRQIGIMKAIGASQKQIFSLYIGMVLLYSVIALLIGIPLGILGGYGLSRLMAGLVNFDVAFQGIPTTVLLMDISIGLIVPLLAAVIPIVSTIRVTAREAMSDAGMSDGGKQSMFDRILHSLRGVSRPMALSLRNTFRRKARLSLTLITLMLAGAIFIAIFSVRDSLTLTLDGMYDYIDYDVYVSFNKAYRIDQLESIAKMIPGVVEAEAWRSNSARRVRNDDTESDNFNVQAPAVGSKLIHPTVLEGRWLLPEDDNAVVVNTLLLKEESDISVGDDITLTIGGDESTWRVVGIVANTPPEKYVYVNLPYFSKTIGGYGQAGVVFVTTKEQSKAYQIAAGKVIESTFEGMGFNVRRVGNSSTEQEQIQSRFNILILFLLIMAVLLAVVGAIGLAGTMSLNVFERRREIGVMRAIGASTRGIFLIVTVEGVLIGLISWLVSIGLAYPLSLVLSNAVGISIMETNLIYKYSIFGAMLWLGLVLVLSTIASLIPARNATKVSVRVALAYE